MPRTPEQRKKEKDALKEAYQRRKNVLIKALGGCCEKCASTDFLTLDHKTEEGRTWKHSDFGRMQRIVMLEKEYLEDKLRVLCSTCNSKDGAYRRVHGKPMPEELPKEIPI